MDKIKHLEHQLQSLSGNYRENVNMLSTQEIKKIIEGSLSETESEMSFRSPQVNIN